MATQNQNPLQLNRTLNTGSQGEDVKLLQTYLSGLGIKGPDGKPLKADGIYGPATKSAVMQFQLAHPELKADGIAGPKTGAVMAKLQNTSAPANITGTSTGRPVWATDEIWNKLTPQQQQYFTLGEGFIGANKAKGFAINPNTTIDETAAQKFWDKAKQEMAPVYQEQITNELGQAQRDIESLGLGYKNTLAQREADYSKNLEENRNALAKSGGGMSSVRNKMEQEMMAQENRNRAALENKYQNEMGNVGRTTESAVGQPNIGNFQLPTMASSRVGLQGVGGNRTLGTIKGNWDPGTYKYGTIPREQRKATQALADYTIGQANEQYSQGRNYNNLMNTY